MSTLAKQIIEQLSANRPTITNSTIKTYTSLLSNLLKKLDSTELKTLDDTTKVIDHVSTLSSAQTQKTLLSALYVLTGKEAYKTAMVKYSDVVNKDYAQKRTKESRKEAGITKEKIQEIYNQVRTNLSTNPTFDHYNDYIIVCLTSGIFLPPRRSLDWCAMKLKDFDKQKDNFIQGNVFVINKFKTAKFVAPEDRRIPIPAELKRILLKWKKINPTDHLLFQKNGNPYTSSSFTKALNRLYGKGVSTDMLRSIYLTHKFGKVADQLDEMNKVTKAMGSSSNAAMNFYIKKDQE